MDVAEAAQAVVAAEVTAVVEAAAAAVTNAKELLSFLLFRLQKACPVRL